MMGMHVLLGPQFMSNTSLYKSVLKQGLSTFGTWSQNAYALKGERKEFALNPPQHHALNMNKRQGTQPTADPNPGTLS